MLLVQVMYSVQPEFIIKCDYSHEANAPLNFFSLEKQKIEGHVNLSDLPGSRLSQLLPTLFTMALATRQISL